MSAMLSSAVSAATLGSCTVEGHFEVAASLDVEASAKLAQYLKYYEISVPPAALARKLVLAYSKDDLAESAFAQNAKYNPQSWNAAKKRRFLSEFLSKDLMTRAVVAYLSVTVPPTHGSRVCMIRLGESAGGDVTVFATLYDQFYGLPLVVIRAGRAYVTYDSELARLLSRAFPKGTLERSSLAGDDNAGLYAAIAAQYLESNSPAPGHQR